jgi:hypothetical protein
MEKQSSLQGLHKMANEYIRTMIQNVKGMKGIILDEDTQVIFSLVTSKSTAINEEIFMFENIQFLKLNQQYNIIGIFFIRPTEHNLKLLSNILRANLLFKEVYISKLSAIINRFQ